MIKIDEVETVDDLLILPLWKLYKEIFTDINRMAVQRHLMYYEEFTDMLVNSAITKYLAKTDDTNEVVGLGVLTNQLDEWPLISPEYFECHFPKLYEAKKIWYVGFIGVSSSNRASTTFTQLLDSMSKPARDANGMCVMDFCSWNVQVRKLAERSALIMRRIDTRTKLEHLDQQEFYSMSFFDEETE